MHEFSVWQQHEESFNNEKWAPHFGLASIFLKEVTISIREINISKSWTSEWRRLKYKTLHKMWQQSSVAERINYVSHLILYGVLFILSSAVFILLLLRIIQQLG